MIRFIEPLQCFECEICGDVHEVMRRDLRDPEKMLQLNEALTAEHKPCEEYRDRPDLARAARDVKRAMKREFLKLERRKAA